MNRVEPNRNVYVGHRYVPLLVGEWDKSIQYEGLSIVTFQGASYTSKRMTPAGIDIKNEEYWVLTGNYDAQVEYYRLETERVSKELETKANKEELENFKTDINSDFEFFKGETDNKISTFKTDINSDFEFFKGETDNKISTFKTDINDDFNEYKLNTDDDIRNFKNEVNTSVSDIRNDVDNITVFPKNFGAFGDGETDDTSPMQDCINFAIENGATIDGENKTYIISDVIRNHEKDHRDRNIGLYINNSVIMKNMYLKTMDDSEDFTTPINVYCDYDDVVIFDNVHVDGNRDNQTHTTASQDGGMHGIRLTGNVNREIGVIQILNSSIKNCQSDGLLASSNNNRHMYVFNSDFINNSRNGVTDNFRNDVTFEKCKFNETHGSLPMSGYHIEADSSSVKRNLKMIDCEAMDNQNDGIRADGRWFTDLENFYFENIISNNQMTLVTSGDDKNHSHIDKIVIKDSHFESIIITNRLEDNITGTLKNVKIDNVTVETNITITSSVMAENIKIKDVVGHLRFFGNLKNVKIENINTIRGNILRVNRYNENPETYTVHNFTLDGFNDNGQNSGQDTIYMNAGRIENLKILNGMFDVHSRNMRVANSYYTTIKGNTFKGRTDWNPFILLSGGDYHVVKDNIFNNSNEEGTTSSGEKVITEAVNQIIDNLNI